MVAAAFLASVAGELDTVNGKNVPANVALCIAGQQHLAEQGLIWSLRLATNLAIRLWPGWLSPLMAMNWTLRRCSL
jgi:hypothetical protein